MYNSSHFSMCPTDRESWTLLTEPSNLLVPHFRPRRIHQICEYHHDGIIAASRTMRVVVCQSLVVDHYAHGSSPTVVVLIASIRAKPFFGDAGICADAWPTASTPSFFPRLQPIQIANALLARSFSPALRSFNEVITPLTGHTLPRSPLSSRPIGIRAAPF